ncbi:PaaX family transcriptional regulator C-terminal domain-containing protein [Nocardiopsis gilva]|uniref:PaaX family transcriptional regulator n=1 Tax=Nocardiopsis gilva TaxID=280236 RepID=UPI001E3D8B11|nr:PaaX family transcriptional regulator C-terminal domain-containing protein [Nocardiopsis gilva]
MTTTSGTTYRAELAEHPQERQNRRPRSLIVSFFGTYAREIGGWVPVAGLIPLMTGLDVDAPGVRSAVSRLKRRGLLASERVGGVAGYRLSPEGLAMFDEGDRRIFDRRVASLADGWVLVVFSIPESERHKRHLLRSRLGRLGFGTTAAGVWIAPAHLTDDARHTIADLGMESYVQLFHSHHLGFGELASTVAQWWDLDALQEMYRGFLDAHAPVLDRWRRHDREATRTSAEEHAETAGAGPEGAAAFADHLRAVDAWRHLPYLDPGLPPDLLPDPWAGRRAADVFFALHELLRGPALEHVRAATGQP